MTAAGRSAVETAHRARSPGPRRRVIDGVPAMPADVSRHAITGPEELG